MSCLNPSSCPFYREGHGKGTFGVLPRRMAKPGLERRPLPVPAPSTPCRLPRRPLEEAMPMWTERHPGSPGRLHDISESSPLNPGCWGEVWDQWLLHVGICTTLPGHRLRISVTKSAFAPISTPLFCLISVDPAER